MNHRSFAFACLLLSLTLGVATTGCRSAQGAGSSEGAATVVYLVRHAEKQLPRQGESLPDPALDANGGKRAARLAEVLGNAAITNIFSTDTIRTRQTIGPIAEKLGLKIESYNGRALKAFAEKLRATPGRHLVSGHSNTTPALVGLLGGEAGPPIEEKNEYDRLYIVVIPADGEPTTVLLRYGESALREEK